MLKTTAWTALFVLVTAPAAGQTDALQSFTADWRTDPVWYDGQAELADYNATRIIYGQHRDYVARIMVNKEKASPRTFTKAADDQGREVFKLHVRDDPPTEKYTYHFSTMAYIGTDDLKSLKLDMGSQEDCGASMKLVVNHNGELNWKQYSYFPNEGWREGEMDDPPANLVFKDAMPLVLRGYPFDEPRDIDLAVLPDQKTTKWSPMRPKRMTVRYVGRETLDLPIGSVDAHHLRLVPRGWKGQDAYKSREHVDYWFAADPAMRHVMVRYDSQGQTYRLQSLKRGAYWR